MSIRELLIDWLTSSRYISWLEARHQEQRQDFTVRLGEKDAIIQSLRSEKAALQMECHQMRSVLLPYGSSAGAEFVQKYGSPSKPPVVPAFDGPDDWQSELQRVLREEEELNGTHGERREKIYEPSTDDGA